MMRRLTPVIAISLLFGLAFATQVLQFRGELLSETSVELQWTVDDETGISGFQLRRSADGVTFNPIFDWLTADGSLSYSYIDTPMGFTGTDTERIYYYALYLRDNEGNFYLGCDPIEVNFIISNVTMTWGTLKAMFR